MRLHFDDQIQIVALENRISDHNGLQGDIAVLKYVVGYYNTVNGGTFTTVNPRLMTMPTVEHLQWDMASLIVYPADEPSFVCEHVCSWHCC